jgi:hypothetical protein
MRECRAVRVPAAIERAKSAARLTADKEDRSAAV